MKKEDTVALCGNVYLQICQGVRAQGVLLFPETARAVLRETGAIVLAKGGDPTAVATFERVIHEEIGLPS